MSVLWPCNVVGTTELRRRLDEQGKSVQGETVDECGSGQVVNQLATATSGDHNPWRI